MNEWINSFMTLYLIISDLYFRQFRKSQNCEIWSQISDSVLSLYFWLYLYFSQFWLFFTQNSEFTFRNLDFFSQFFTFFPQNSELKSRNSDFFSFSCNSDFSAEISECTSCNSDFLLQFWDLILLIAIQFTNTNIKS